MKFNWGTGIVIAFALFMTFILYFVTKVQTDSKYDNDMVIDEYYKKDAVYNEQMIKMQNAKSLDSLPVIKNSSSEILIIFPDSYNNFNGKVSFYRPSDKKLDFEAQVSSSGSSLLIPKNKLAGGRWDIVIEWNMSQRDYFYKKEMYL